MSRRLRSALIVATVLAVVIAVGQLVFPGTKAAPAGGGLAADPPPAASGVAPASPPPGQAGGAASVASVRPGGPSEVINGVPMGYSHDAAGAQAAAVSFARAYGTLVALDEAGALAARRTMASSAAAEQLVADTRAKLAALRRVWPVGAVTYRVAPLAVRVRMDGPEAATADVWYVGVVAGKGLPTYEEWVTETYRLVWERDDWRIASDVETAGPRPDPGRQRPASAGELESRLAGFEALR